MPMAKTTQPTNNESTSSESEDSTATPENSKLMVSDTRLTPSGIEDNTSLPFPNSAVFAIASMTLSE